MIELQKYSKIDEEHLLKRVTIQHTDSRLKVAGYATLAIAVSLIGITFTLGRIVFLPSDERALKVFKSDSDSDSMKAFINFIAEQGRTYEDRTETARRYSIFKANLDNLSKYKVHEKHLPYTLSMDNQFADLTGEEFVAKVGGGAIVPKSVMSANGEKTIFTTRKETVPIFDKAEGELPEYKNWFEEGMVSASQDQSESQCANAWAFSTVASMEALAAINGIANPEFSAQQLIDCDSANNGCQGGWAYKGFAYTSKYGLMSKSDYGQNSGKQGECMFDETKATFKNTGMTQERYVSNIKLKSLVSKQPVTTGIVVTSNFRLYSSGIMTEELLSCSDSQKEINHSVTIVGYGKTDLTNVASTWCSEYWIGSNSWGTAWGEQGLFKLCMDHAGKSKIPYGICQVNRFPSYPTLN